MKPFAHLRVSLVTTATLSFSLATGIPPALATPASLPSNPSGATHSSTTATPDFAQSRFAQTSEYQIAQVTPNCRRVSLPTGGLTVREAPSIDSPVVGEVPSGQNVAIVNRGASGWVPISAPFSGYVPASNLTTCPGATPPTPTDSCRAVTGVRNRLNVRQEPSVNATIIGSLSPGQQITINNRGASGWVPISQPIDGFVSASYLRRCNG